MVFLFIFILIFEISIHAGMPLLGHDNAIWFDQLMIGKWHFAHQGLSPLRFTPHACGGVPVYGDPETIYYSLAQALALFMHPWLAMQICVVATLVAGYFGWFYFGKKILNLKESWSQLLALMQVANGFIFIHLAVGHFQMHTMPLMGCFLLLIFDRTKDTPLNLLTRASIFALLTIYTLSAAGYNVLLFTAITALLMLPFDIIFSLDLKSRIKELGKRFLITGGLSLLIIFSRLVAVFSFLRSYSRDEGFGHLWKDANILVYIAKSFWSIFPTRDSLYGFGWDLHEKAIFLSPITWAGLLVGSYLLIKKKNWILAHWKKSSLLFICSVFTLLFLIQLTQGYGFLVDHFLQFPGIRSLRVASRFLYILSIFITILSVYCFSFVSFRPKIGMALTCLSLITGWYAVRYQLLLNENFLIRTQQFEFLEKAHYQDLAVAEVKEGNTDFIRAGTTCHIELMKKSYPIPLKVGAVKQQIFGTYNLMNPSCYQYPEENNCTPGDRIRIGDEENFENFTHGRPVTWRLSKLQYIADYTSLFTIFSLLGIVFYRITRRKTA